MHIIPDVFYRGLPPEVAGFIYTEKSLCWNNKIEIILSDSDSVTVSDGEIQGNGHFIDTPDKHTKGEIHCAAGKPLEEWLPVFVHETCHKDQFMENDCHWEGFKFGKHDAIDFIDFWINGGVELSEKNKDTYFNACIGLELDCERRSVKKIKKFNLPIDTEEYTQKANSYVLFYHVIRLERKWYTIGKEPYNIEEVWRKMPNTFLSDKDYYNPPEDLIDIIRKGV